MAALRHAKGRGARIGLSEKPSKKGRRWSLDRGKKKSPLGCATFSELLQDSKGIGTGESGGVE